MNHQNEAPEARPTQDAVAIPKFEPKTSDPKHPSLALNWAFAHGGPVGHCLFKSRYEDFKVDEVLPFEPEGEGEHALLWVEKQGDNTDWLAGQLANYAGVKRQSVSYAGRKDRQGITRQWFCVTLPGRDDPDWEALALDGVRVLTSARHRKKLRTGALKGNRFVITLRNLVAEKAILEQRLTVIRQAGVPNYYGTQRFGVGGRNLSRAMAMFDGRMRVNRNKRSLYLSAARSWLFNRIVSERVTVGDWNQLEPGDVLGFCDSNSLIVDVADSGAGSALDQRLAAGDLSPTAALWGRGESVVSGQIQEFEQRLAAEVPSLCDGLEHAGLRQERRITRLMPQEMTWRWQDDETLELSFYLPKGCFATSVLRELLDCREPVNDDHTAVQ